MFRLLFTCLLCLHMVMPIAAWAQSLRDPLAVPMKTYLLMLTIALLGGFARWYGKVRKGDIPGFSVFHLVGELATSALAGLMCFWVCEWMGLSQMLSAPLTGIAGHMGTRAIAMFEDWAAKRAAKVGELS